MKQTIDHKKIKEAATRLSQTTENERNAFLYNLAKKIMQKKKNILNANALDVRDAKTAGLEQAFIARLLIDDHGIDQLVAKLNSIASLKSEVGEIIEQRTEGNGLVLKKVRVPLGVLLVIYEARPEVTIDVAGLCVKSGNAAILKGGSEALRTNKVLFECIKAALRATGLADSTVSFITSGDRNITNRILQRNDVIDLIIARGGYEMVKAVMNISKIPVLAHAAGGARIYVDKSADIKMALRILVDAKITKPAACNSLDTILVHQDIAHTFVPEITKAMRAKEVVVKKTMSWSKETLGLVVGIRVVKDVEEAVKFIHKYTKSHTEGIIAQDTNIIDYFTKSIDAAAIFINSSTRLHDGYVFGLGSEMGISTSKIHARGPVGLKELTTYKWQVYGKGNIREK
ncbi:MAG: glutamate-5-semialdehyde dehydrogenase [Parcubacteria group bacterium Gr01-1014_48]|nr:MAG: glutamate-5-semialdehyde dehydrogenase [Parcubacteria group bacterium Gr01-1014_48]